MRLLNIQVQPERVPTLDMARTRGIVEALAKDRTLVAKFESVEGDDDGPYVNFTFAAKDLPKLWASVQKKVLRNTEIGPAVSKSSIIICEGSEGWDNYRLLHHYDGRFKLDEADEI